VADLYNTVQGKNMETEVYSYKEASRFLKDQWLIRKDKNPALSVRSWAKHLGFKSHSMLQHFLDGDKKIPKKYIPVFIKHLKLSTREGLYFETMVDLQRAKSLEEKMIYLERLNELLPAQPIKIHEVEAYKSIRDPLHNLIFEMVNLVDFKYDLKWIQQRIYFETSVESIHHAIERLIGLGLLQETPDNRLVATGINFTNPVDVASKGVQEYHKNASLLAAEMVTKQGVDEREFNGYALSVPVDSLPKAKTLIREFIKQFASELGANEPHKSELTYQLNVQFFQLTNNPKKEKTK